MAMSDTITSMQTHTSNAYTMIGYGTDLTGINKNLENLSTSIFNAFLEALRNPNTLFTNLPKKSGTGSNITLNDTANAPMRVELGASELTQASTTQSANLFDEDKYKNATYTTSTYKYTQLDIKGNRTLYFKASLKSGKTAISGLTLALSSVGTNPNSGTTCISISNGTITTSSKLYSKDFTGIDTLYLAFYPTSTSVADIFDTYNLWVSTTDTTYVPFTPNSPSPDYPSDIHTISGSNTIKVEGKNLFDVQNVVYVNGKILNDSGTEINDGSGGYTQMYIPVKSNTDYTISGLSASGSKRIYYFDKNKTFISRTSTYSTSYATFTTPNNCYFIDIQYFLTGNDFSTYQLEVGSTATTYEPYVSQEADIDLSSKNLAYTGWAQDFITRINASSKASFEMLDSRMCIHWTPDAGYNDYDNKYFFKTNFKENTQYTISCDLYTTNSNNYGNLMIEYTDGTTTEITGTYNQWKHISYTSTSGKTIKYLHANWRGGVSDIDINTFMVYEGTTALPYVPYYDYGFCGSIGNYEDKFIRTSGKNLWNEQWESGYYNRTTGAKGSGNTYIRSVDYIAVKPNTTIYFNMPSDFVNYAVIFYDSSKTITGTIPAPTKTSSTSFIVPTTASYFTFYGDTGVANATYKNNVMITYGDTASEYEPYGSNEWYIKKNIGKVVLDGTNDGTWQKGSTTAINRYLLNGFVADKNVASLGLTNYFKIESATNAGTCYINSTQLVINFDTYDASQTVNDFKTWLSTHNTIVYYQLATPIYTQITGTLAEQLEQVYKNMLSQKGQTNISQVNNDLSFNMSVQAIEEV